MVDNKISSFYSSMNATIKGIKKVRESYDPIMAFDFNALNFFSVGENKTSEILAFFLDPKSAHGQGALFLELFFKQFKLKPYWDKYKDLSVDVQCEKVIKDNRRIDIYIQFGNNDYLIGVENKRYLHTNDQGRQLEDYNSYLQANSKGNYVLFYLSPSGKDIGEVSISKEASEELKRDEKLKHIYYEDHIIPLVNEWHLRCKAIRVKTFLQDFEQYLKNQYTGEKFMDYNKQLIEYALKSENTEVTLAIVKNTEAIYVALLEQLRQQLKKYTDEHNYELEWKISRNEKWARFKVRVKDVETKGLVVSFEFEEKYTQNFYFGFSYAQQPSMLNSVELENLRKSFLAKFNSCEKASDGWPCSAFFELRYWHADDYLLIANGEMCKKIINRIEELIQFANELTF